MKKNQAHQGKPDAGKPHAWLRRGSLLYNRLPYKRGTIIALMVAAAALSLPLQGIGALAVSTVAGGTGHGKVLDTRDHAFGLSGGKETDVVDTVKVKGTMIVIR